MSADRRSRARLVVSIVLAVDALSLIAIGIDDSRPKGSAGTFHPEVLLTSILVASTFVIALGLLLSRPGVERSGAARFMAWTTGFGGPLALLLLMAIGMPGPPKRHEWSAMVQLLSLALVQMLIPASVRWARAVDGPGFVATFARTSAILILAWAYFVFRLLFF